MKEKGKAVETCNSGDYNTASSDLPCNKHPFSCSVGICAYCLKDRLMKLVCSDCGEQRLSSCSCSQVFSYTNPCSVEVGSVGRISFLIENERSHESQHLNYSKPKNGERSEEFVLLKRSRSSCVDMKKSSGFWRIRRLFRKKREKGICERSTVGGFEEKSSDVWSRSRSRSLCSFRDCGFNDLDEGSDFEKQGGFNEAEPRKSGSRGVLDSENGSSLKGVRKGGLLELDSGSNVANGSVVLVKQSDFIDLKLDLASESKPEFSAPKMSDFSDSDFSSLIGGAVVGHHECGGSLRSLIGDRFLGNGGSCRITMNDRRMRKGRKGHKVWRWIFKHHSGWERATKKVENHILKP